MTPRSGTPLAAWPALTGASLPVELGVGEAVWGKAPAARTDYRWLARTRSIVLPAGLERELSLGSEDRPRRGVLALRVLPDLVCAVHAHPSRSTDAAGRGGAQEKHLLLWSRRPDVPPALAGLALLPAVAELGDEVWWPRRNEAAWEDGSAILDLPPRRPSRIEPAEVEAVIARGVEELRQLVDVDRLAALYHELRASETGWLREVAGPLSPEALACLLLPLPWHDEPALSAAGWLPSSRADTVELAARWRILVEPEGSHRAPPSPSPDVDAMETAAALLAANPSRLPPWAARGTPVTGTPRSSLSVDDPAGANRRWGRTLPCPPPPPGRQGVVEALYQLARRVDRRWLDPRRLRGTGVTRLTELEARYVRELVRIVERAHHDDVDADQWETKVDLLTSAAVALAPSPASAELLHARRWRRVPPLFFVLALDRVDPEHLRELADYSFPTVGGDGAPGRPDLRRAVDERLGQARSGAGAPAADLRRGAPPLGAGPRRD